MRAGILTYHDAVNYGAALQAYALQQAVLNFGHEVEIIDYSNRHRRRIYSTRARLESQIRQGHLLSATKTLLGAPWIYVRRQQFSRYYRRFLRLGPVAYNTAAQLMQDPPVYDLYIAGSDQIWNSRHNGDDMNYLLDFVRDSDRTASYASSFGLEKIPDSLESAYARALARIAALSVREQAGAKIVHDLTGRSVPVVLDPVFLLERNHWLSLAVRHRRLVQPCLVVYTSRAAQIEAFLSGHGSRLRRWRRFNVSSDVPFGDFLNPHVRVRSAAGPQEFLGILAQADLILTTSFHGTAFAILFEKPFVSFLSSDSGKNARITELLGALDLSDRIYHPDMSAAQILAPIAVEGVRSRLAELRQHSLAFLSSILAFPSRPA